ncbi:hypothetical protein [Streptomyces sp. NBC_01353]|uniref:hypothetical protein n=1 Tax=Streptomyces sp. NBC_01353 TaxID=2903835 RepID=UPI002E363112|nr:hypothetical protein [Streptomyces sp. NBC_01353]
MNVTDYKLGARYRSGLDRVEAIADQAARLVEKKLGERVGHVEIVVADRRNALEVLSKANQKLAGTTRKAPRQGLGSGYTTLNPGGGTLIVIDAEACAAARNLDETVVHELVHAAQIGRPGKREAILANIRNNLGIDRVSYREAWAASRQIKADEREALRLESLARKLR